MSGRSTAFLMVAVAAVTGGFVARAFPPAAPARAQAMAAVPPSSSHWVLLHHETSPGGLTIPLWVNLEQANSIRFDTPAPGGGAGPMRANVILARQIAVVNDAKEVELLRRYVQERQRK